MAFYEERDGAIILNIRVVPRAAKEGIQGLVGDALKVRIQAPPVEGKANACLVRFLADAWKLPRAQIEILSGETGRNKRLRISRPTAALRALLEEIGRA